MSKSCTLYTYPAIEYLLQFDFRDKTVFEYGSGNSSLFWAKRAKSVISVENNEKWFNIIEKTKLKNQQILLRKNKEEYLNVLQENGSFDIIVIDASYRMECIFIATNFLNKGGMIIFDNSDRYPNNCKYLRNKYFYQIDFHGFGPQMVVLFVDMVRTRNVCVNPR